MGFGLLRSDGSDLGQSRAWLCLTGGGGDKNCYQGRQFSKSQKESERNKSFEKAKAEKEKKRKRKC